MLLFNINKQFGVETSFFADLCYWLLIALTAANYSFITFTIGGDQMLAGPLKPLAFARLPICVFGYFFLIFTHKRGISLGKISGAMVILVVAVLLSVPMSPSVMGAMIYGGWFIFMVLFLAKYAYYLAEQGGYEYAKFKLVIPLMLYGLYFLCLSILKLPEYNIGRPFPALFSTRTQVAMISPLFLGGMACCWARLRGNRLISLPLLAMIVFCLAVLAVSGKRASIICALLIGTAYFVFTMKASGKFAFIASVPVLLFLVFSSGFDETARDASEFTIQRVEKGLDSKTSTSINARLHIWDIVGDLVSKYPLGVGLSVGRKLVGGGLHNTYLGYLLETGWLGFFTVMFLVIWSLSKSYFSGDANKRAVLFFIMLPCLLYSITEYNTVPGQSLFIPFWVAIVYGLLPKFARRPQ